MLSPSVPLRVRHWHPIVVQIIMWMFQMCCTCTMWRSENVGLHCCFQAVDIIVMAGTVAAAGLCNASILHTRAQPTQAGCSRSTLAEHDGLPALFRFG
jgi:hypothetical protein